MTPSLATVLGLGLAALLCGAVVFLASRLRAAGKEHRALSSELAGEKRYATETEALVGRFEPVLATLSLDGVLDWVARAARDLTGSTYAHAALVEGNRHRTAAGGDLDLYPSWWHPSIQRLVTWSCQEQDTIRDERAICGIRDFLAVPFAEDGGNEALGVLIVGGKALNAEEERALVLLARGASKPLLRAVEAPGGRDPVSGLPNESSLHHALGRELSRGETPTVLLVDVDRLWRYEQVYGVAAGDAFLGEVGRVLGEGRRLTFRLSRSRFALVLKGAEGAKARDAGTAVRRAVLGLAPGSLVPVAEAAVGYARARRGEGDPHLLLDMALRALARSKGRPERISGPPPGAAGSQASTGVLGGDSETGGTVAALLSAAGARDPSLTEHMKAVANLSRRIGARMALPEDELAALTAGALLHDVGKIGMPDAILKSEDLLSEKDRDSVWRHPTVGAGILASVEGLSWACLAVKHHHERFDGEGYPDGLKGENIPLVARIVSVADAFDSMIRGRLYRRTLSAEAALDELASNSGTQFDPEVVRAFEELMNETDSWQVASD